MMTDPNETANLVEQITGAYREHRTEEAFNRPLTYQEARNGSIADRIDRYRELADRDLTARNIAALKARGEWTEDHARALDPDRYPPLTVAEHLEMIALGEVIARHYRHPSQVDRPSGPGPAGSRSPPPPVRPRRLPGRLTGIGSRVSTSTRA